MFEKEIHWKAVGIGIGIIILLILAFAPRTNEYGILGLALCILGIIVALKGNALAVARDSDLLKIPPKNH